MDKKHSTVSRTNANADTTAGINAGINATSSAETPVTSQGLTRADSITTDGPSLSRREFLGSTAVTAALAATGSIATFGAPGIARAQTAAADRKFVFSTPFSGQDSFTGQIGGLNAGVKEFGGDLTIVDASFDLKKQNDQIAASAASKPDALIVLAVDPVGCSKAVDAASKSGVPVFLMDSIVPNAGFVTAGFHNNFGMGQETMRWLGNQLGGKGKIAVMELPINEAWNARDFGRAQVLRNEFPDIEVVATWAFDPTGKTTPRAAADAFLAAHDDLDGIWCAWDNAAMEASLACMAAGRTDIIATGTDGGKAAFEVMGSGGPFKMTCAQSFFTQAYDLVDFAHQHLDGKPVPRVVINPTVLVTAEMVQAADGKAADYDKAGGIAALGWSRTL